MSLVIIYLPSNLVPRYLVIRNRLISQLIMYSIAESSQSQLNSDMVDEDIEQELAKLELEILSEEAEPSAIDKEKHDTERKEELFMTICDDLSKLNISNASTKSHGVSQLRDKASHHLHPEAA